MWTMWFFKYEIKTSEHGEKIAQLILLTLPLIDSYVYLNVLMYIYIFYLQCNHELTPDNSMMVHPKCECSVGTGLSCNPFSSKLKEPFKRVMKHELFHQLSTFGTLWAELRIHFYIVLWQDTQIAVFDIIFHNWKTISI